MKVAVVRTLTINDLSAADSSAVKAQESLRAAGIGAEAVKAGRVVRVACAMMTDGTWGGLGVLPNGTTAANNTVWRMKVIDTGSDSRDSVNPIVGAVPELDWSGKSASTFIPNWRELGRASNVERVELPPSQRGRYSVVFSRFLVDCR